jgi:repressor LexA
MGAFNRVLVPLRRFWQRHRRMPSYRELASLAGYRSTNAAVKLARRLQDAGFISTDGTGKLVPARLWGQTRVLGDVRAGFPSPAEEELADTMSLDEWLIGNKEATFMLKVQGDSMIEAGIMPGDMVLVERGRTPRDGDVVIAEVDGQWTMKTLRHRSRGVVLIAANAKYPPIRPKETLNITAVVVAVVRRYRA